MQHHPVPSVNVIYWQLMQLIAEMMQLINANYEQKNSIHNRRGQLVNKLI